METQTEKVFKALPEPENQTQLLLQAYNRCQLMNVRSRNESTCKKCLTEWTKGQFTLTMKPSNHKRKERRQHRIDRLQKSLKTANKTSEILKLKKKIQHLQEQNNHVAIYKCKLCKATTKVLCWKPKTTMSLRQTTESVTAGEEEKHKEITNKARKGKGKKKMKTAGLIIPPPKSAQAPTHHKQLSKAKLSNMLLQATSKSQLSNLNQFLK